MRTLSAPSLTAALLTAMFGSMGNADEPQDKRAKFRERMLEKFDMNRDGKLDDNEQQAMREHWQRMRAKRAAAEAAGNAAVEPKGEAQPAPAKIPTEAELLKLYDINGNGRLDPEERLIAEQEQKKEEPVDDEKPDDVEVDPTKKLESIGEETWDDFEKRLLTKYDENGNEKLDSAERKKATREITEWRVKQRKISEQKEAALRGLTVDQRRLVAMFDDNKNFKLDNDEREYAREQFARLRKEGLETAAELQDRFIKQFDTNKNGQFDAKEKPAALDFVIKVAIEMEAAKLREKNAHKWPGKKP